MSETERVSLYEAVGGSAYFDGLVDQFYEFVEADPLLRPLYPEDLTAPRRHTSLFLQQYWGGPTTYSEERGHPRLRMRHMPFAIGQPERDAWLEAMTRAVDVVPMSVHLTDEGHDIVAQMLLDYFDHASTAMINQP